MKSGSNKENRMIRKRFLTSVLLVLLAFVAITVFNIACTRQPCFAMVPTYRRQFRSWPSHMFTANYVAGLCM